jgi:Predicted membrane protein (DUF2306)
VVAARSSGGSSIPNRLYGPRRLSTARPCSVAQMDLAVLWGWTAWRAYRAIRQRDIRSHQAWVIRNFALTYAAVTLRSWFGVLIFAQVPFVHGANATSHIMSSAYAPLPFLCWLPNIVIAEFMIRRRGLPALHMTSAPGPERSVTPGQAASSSA